jgi:hypothetical protein
VASLALGCRSAVDACSLTLLPHARGFAGSVVYPPCLAEVAKPAPPFSAPAAFPDGEIKPLALSDYKGKWLVLLFYPKDWTFVCPTELIAFSDAIERFRALNAEVVGVSTDTPETVRCHRALGMSVVSFTDMHPGWRVHSCSTSHGYGSPARRVASDAWTSRCWRMSPRW